MAKNIMTPVQYDKNTVMIVDTLNLAFRWKHAGAVHFEREFLTTVESLRKSYQAEHVVIAADKGASSYRRELYPEYKSGRKEKFKDQTEEEKAEFEAFFEEYSLTLEALAKKYPLFFRFEGCEADDIAAYIVDKLKKTKTIWLISSDRDWDLLITAGVSRFSYVTRKEVTLENWENHYDYDIDDHISIKCLMGDSGDSIPGVEGIGPARAKTLIQQYGTAYDVAAALPINSKYKYVKSLNDFGVDNIIRNYKLMDLQTHCAEALGPDNCTYIDNKLKDVLL